MGYRVVSSFHSIYKTPYRSIITLCDYLVVLHQRYEFISAEQLGCHVFMGEDLLQWNSAKGMWLLSEGQTVCLLQCVNAFVGVVEVQYPIA